MQTLILVSLTMMGVLLLSSCNSVTIQDEQYCAPVFDSTGEVLGAVCDNLLTSNQLILTPSEWVAKVLSWQNAGTPVECTTSKALGDTKAIIEKLCSEAKCDYNTKTLLINGLAKVQGMVVL